MKKYEKPVYSFKSRDFIPIVGTRNHLNRCLNSIDENPILSLNKDYQAQCWIRTSALAIYNLSLITPVVLLGMNGLASLLTN